MSDDGMRSDEEMCPDLYEEVVRLKDEQKKRLTEIEDKHREELDFMYCLITQHNNRILSLQVDMHKLTKLEGPGFDPYRGKQ